eukprot:1150845-Pelagomonas_calceolata.AAC.1
MISSMKTERHNVARRMIIKALSKSPWGAGSVKMDIKNDDRLSVLQDQRQSHLIVIGKAYHSLWAMVRRGGRTVAKLGIVSYLGGSSGMNCFEAKFEDGSHAHFSPAEVRNKLMSV